MEPGEKIFLSVINIEKTKAKYFEKEQHQNKN